MGFLGCSKGSKGRSAHAPNRKLIPTVAIWILFPPVVKVSPTRNGAPTGTTNVPAAESEIIILELYRPIVGEAHSRPAPTSHPLALLLLEPAIDRPVVTLVTVKPLLPTQPPPALP
jgi:hypothetical protein